MKVITFFSRFAIICNVAFLLFILFSRLEANQVATRTRDVVIAVPFLKDLVITLGISAIIINFIMCIVYAIVVLIGKQAILRKWLVILNFLFFIFQLYYFFVRQSPLQ